MAGKRFLGGVTVDNLLPTVFQYENREVRTVLVNGEPWLVASDVCDILEIGNSRDAVSRLTSRMKGVATTDTPGGPQEVSIINEAGVYKLTFTSRKPEAAKFTDWLAEEVIPAIRRNGSYSLVPRTFAEALRLAADQAEQIEAQQKQLALAEPKVEFYDQIIDSKDAIPMGDAAKVLHIKGIGRNNLFAKLRELGVLMADNIPYEAFIQRNYFRVIERKWETPNGEPKVRLQTYVLQRGLDYVRRLLTKEEAP